MIPSPLPLSPTEGEIDAIQDALSIAIAEHLERSIKALGYPVGMGIAPPFATCLMAAHRIVTTVSDKALLLLAERRAKASPASSEADQ